MNNSKQKCVTHAQATFSRLQVMEYKEIEGSTYGGWKTPTLGDWLELFDPLAVTIHLLIESKTLLAEKVIFGETIQCHFNLATNEPDNWDTLAELLNL